MVCAWPIDRTCLPIAESEPDIVQQSEAEDLAVHVLWALTGRQFGVCPVIARPCPSNCGVSIYPSGYAGLPFFPMWIDGGWRNVGCGCGGTCSYQSPRVIHLASRIGLPVQEVTEVVIAGELLDDSEYKLEGDMLYRIGADWPSQDLSSPLDEPGTWSVTYTRGIPPPPGAGKLVGLLAAEFLAACNGGKCRLPRRVRSVTRQGVSMDMLDPTDILESGFTGIPEIDIFIRAVNPHRVASPARVR